MNVQDVVILGTGAFALEAMEAANRAGANSITLITRPRDRYESHFGDAYLHAVTMVCSHLETSS